MLRTEVMMQDLGKWIFSKAGFGTKWDEEFNRLLELSKSHPDFASVKLTDFMEAALKGLCGTTKQPGGTERAVIFFLMEKNGWTRDNYADIIRELRRWGFKNPDEVAITLIMSSYRSSGLFPKAETPVEEPVVETEVPTGKKGGRQKSTTATKRLEFLRLYFSEKTIPKPIPGGELIELQKKLNEAGIPTPRKNTISVDVNKLRKERLGAKEPEPRKVGSTAVSVSVRKEPDGEFVDIQSLTQVQLALHFLDEDGSIPSKFKNKAAFCKFVASKRPGLNLDSFRGTILTVQKKIRDSQLPKQPAGPAKREALPAAPEPPRETVFEAAVEDSKFARARARLEADRDWFQYLLDNPEALRMLIKYEEAHSTAAGFSPILKLAE